jgi:flagellin
MPILIDAATEGLKRSHQIARNKKALDTSTNNLASGMRINKAADDVAGCSISTTLSAELRSLQQAKRNGEQATSFIQSAEGYLQTIQNNLSRMRELTLQSASDTLGNVERQFLNIEFSRASQENENIVKSAKFGSLHMLDGSMGTLNFQIGVFNNKDNVLSLDLNQYAVDTDKIKCSADILTKEGAQKCIEEMDDMIEYISGIRANMGALQNRLNEIISNLDNEIAGKSDANSKIKDTDFAMETVENAKNKILLEASTAMMAQGNQSINKTAQLLSAY